MGHIITKDGIMVDPEKIRTIMEWPMPKDVADIRSSWLVTTEDLWRVSLEWNILLPLYKRKEKLSGGPPTAKGALISSNIFLTPYPF